MRRIIGGFLVAALLTVTTGCSGQPSKTTGKESSSGKLKVAASFYPMYEFAKGVGGDKVDVTNLVPPGAEPHDWEPTVKDITTLNQSQVFVYNGVGVEQWVDKTLKSLDNKTLVAIETTKGYDLLKSTAEENPDGAEPWNPHLWLDPISAIYQVEAIRDSLIKADAANKTTYEANTAAFVAKLKSLDQEYRTGLTGCGKKEFYTSHAAFGYLAKRYGIEQHAIMGLTPDAEPTSKELTDIINQAKKENIKVIFFETLVSDKLAKIVANEVGAKPMVLNPIEGLLDDEVKAGQNYFTVMRENLANLRVALECK
jgi:zinc transport system substrate-binding protein